jgi:hypothetical protein
MGLHTDPMPSSARLHTCDATGPGPGHARKGRDTGYNHQAKQKGNAMSTTHLDNLETIDRCIQEEIGEATEWSDEIEIRVWARLTPDERASLGTGGLAGLSSRVHAALTAKLGSLYPWEQGSVDHLGHTITREEAARALHMPLAEFDQRVLPNLPIDITVLECWAARNTSTL